MAENIYVSYTDGATFISCGEPVPGSKVDSAQTFTPSQNFTITKLNLYLCKYTVYGNVGTVTITIQETTDGAPNGNVIATGSIHEDDIPEFPTIEWKFIELSHTNLIGGEKYAFVVDASECDSQCYIGIGADITSPSYEGGSYFGNINDGAWLEYLGVDLSFEIWGIPISFRPTAQSVATGTVNTSTISSAK